MTATDSDDPGDLKPVGVYLVTTESNSRYRIDFDTMTATRYPDPDPDPDADNSRLRRDDEERPLHGITEFTLGYPLVLVLNIRGDQIPTIRTTTPVTSIERIR